VPERSRIPLTQNESLQAGRYPGRGGRLWRHRLWGLLAFAVAGQFAAAAAGQKYQSGDWITECETGVGTPECSLMVPFSKTENGQRGAFALAVMVSTGDIAIVGQPVPVRAVVHIGNNPPIECKEMQSCLFPRERSIAAIGQLSTASVILVDVLTAKASFKFSLTTRGYQAGLAQIRAWGYRLFSD
jgi:invasion protein IalB